MQPAQNNQPAGALAPRNLAPQYGAANTAGQQRMQPAPQEAGMPSPGMLSPSVAHRTRRQHVGQNPSENQGGPNWAAYQAHAAAAAQAHAAAQQRNIQMLSDGTMHLPNTEQNMQPAAQQLTGPPSHASDNSLGSLPYGFAQVSTASNHTALPYPPATPNLGAGSSESAPTRPGVSTPLRKTAGEKYPSTRKHLRTIEVRLTCCYDLNKVTSLLRTASRAFFADARAIRCGSDHSGRAHRMGSRSTEFVGMSAE